MSDSPEEPDDAQAAALLDSYLADVLAGRQPNKEGLLAQHPRLAEALACLEALGGLPVIQQSTSRNAASSDTSASRLASTEAWFGSYELLGEIGRGGMGVVYKARHKDLDRIVALKMILTSQLASDDQVRRFRVEAQAVARLSHPHIVPIFEAGQVHGQHYFAMQFIDGASLAERLRQGPLSIDDATRCLTGIARAVAYLHSRGIIHRDLKPDNILLDAGGHPYLTDFGLVKLLESDSHTTASGAIVGTPSYMAPEQAAVRHAAVGPRSDIYSLGAILYEMLTGRPPFRAPTPLETLVQVIEGEPAPPRQVNSRIPAGIDLICRKCMAKEPDQRYATAAELADDLERFARREPIQARPHGVLQRWQRWVRQEPALASHLGVILLIMVISQVNYQLFHPVSFLLHARVNGTLAAWAVLSICCQWLLRRDRHADIVRLTWLAIDGVLLTTELWLVEAIYSPLLITYALFIVASGLWFRKVFVWFTTGLASAGYLLLLVDAAARDELGPNPHYHIIFLVGLLALGFMVAYQVQRVRVLSRYYEHRRLP